MAPPLIVLMVITIAVLASTDHKCEGFSASNVTAERQPQKRVEIIELMLNPSLSASHHQKNNEKLDDDGDDVEPRYEIFIRPSKNNQDKAGTQKIKIFVESEDYGNPEQLHSISSNASLLQQDGKYRPLPLTVKAPGLNVNTFQHQNTDRVRSVHVDKSINSSNVNPSKRQVHTSQPQVVRSYISEVAKKEVRPDHEKKGLRTLKDVVDEVNARGSGLIAQQYDERENVNKRTAITTGKEGLTLAVSSSDKRGGQGSSRNSYEEVEEMQSYRPSVVAAQKFDEPENYRRTERPERQYNSESVFESHPPPHHAPDATQPGGRTLVYNPYAGISSAPISSLNHKEFMESPQQSPEGSRHTGESPGRIPRPVSELDTQYSYGKGGGYEDGEVRSERDLNRGRNQERRPERNPAPDGDYYLTGQPAVSSGGRHSSSDYSKSTSSHSAGKVQTEQRPTGRRSSSTQTGYGITEDYRDAYDEELYNLSVLSSTGLPYEKVPEKNSGTRLIQVDHYLGFPESYTSNMQVTSRPISNENPSVFTARMCPGVFKYTSQESDRWNAEIYVSTDVVLVGMRLDITLDRRADLLAAMSAEVKSRDNIRFTVLSLKKRLVPKYPETVEIMVKYHPNEPAPNIETINLNGRMICPATANPPPRTTTEKPVYVFPGDVQHTKRTTERYVPIPTEAVVVNEYDRTTRRTTPKSVTTKRTPLPEFVSSSPNVPGGNNYGGSNRPNNKNPNNHRPSFVNSKPPGQNKPQPTGLSSSDNYRPVSGTDNNGNNYYYNENSGLTSAIASHKPNDREKKNFPCGLPAVQPRPLITNGHLTTRGQWPWHAALYKNSGLNISYSCGGTLVSDLHVITAAHCVTAEYSTTSMDPKLLLVHLGKYHLYSWGEDGMAIRQVSRVNVHPNYNATDFRSDLAVLTLSSRVEYNDFIRPVCLWDKRNTRIDDIVGLEGTIVGWGFDEGYNLTQELKQAKMPVVKQDDCLWSYPTFYPKFTSNTTYCAGYKNGTSACNGDSGGGMVFPIKVNQENRWFLRGLVSLSPGKKDIRVCDTFHYVIFTDIAKYLPWVEDLISQR